MRRIGIAGQCVAALLGLLFVAACGSDGPSGPTTGAIAVTSSAQTTTDNPSFEYSITIDNGTPRTVTSSMAASYVVPGLSVGAHTVTIRQLAAGCTAGTDSRTVGVVAGDTVDVNFAIFCTRTTGDISVSSATTGVELDPDGYAVTVDGTARGTLGANGTAAVAALTPGSHVVGLTGLASNCSTTAATQNVVVTAGGTSLVRFNVVCIARTGEIRLVVTTTGDDRDADGYVYVIDNLPPLRSPVTNGTITIRNFPLGAHTVRIGDIAENCALTTPATRPIVVQEGTTANVDVTVTCLARGSGTIGFTVADPANDTLPAPAGSAARALDLLSTTGRHAPGWLTLTLRFAGPVVPIVRAAPNSLFGLVQFDLDESTLTGPPPDVNIYGGNAAQGVDITVAFDTDSTTALVRRGTTAVGRVGVRYMADSVVLSIPLSLLNDDGNMTMSGVFGTQTRPTDLMPNTGVILVRRPPGALATAEAIRRSRYASQHDSLALPVRGEAASVPLPVGGWSAVPGSRQ